MADEQYRKKTLSFCINGVNKRTALRFDDHREKNISQNFYFVWETDFRCLINSLTRQRHGNGNNHYRAWNLKACLHLTFVLFRVFQRCNLIVWFYLLVIVISFLPPFSLIRDFSNQNSCGNVPRFPSIIPMAYHIWQYTLSRLPNSSKMAKYMKIWRSKGWIPVSQGNPNLPEVLKPSNGL